MTGRAGVNPEDAWVQVLGGQGVQIGRHIRQENKYITHYIEHQDVHVPPAQVSWPVRVGAVPQPPPAFSASGVSI